MTVEHPSRAGGSIPRTSRDRADEVIGRALEEANVLVKILEVLATCEAVRMPDDPELGFVAGDVLLRHDRFNVLWLRDEARRLLGREG